MSRLYSMNAGIEPVAVTSIDVPLKAVPITLPPLSASTKQILASMEETHRSQERPSTSSSLTSRASSMSMSISETSSSSQHLPSNAHAIMSFDKSQLKSTFSSSLAPRSGVLLSQAGPHASHSISMKLQLSSLPATPTTQTHDPISDLNTSEIRLPNGVNDSVAPSGSGILQDSTDFMSQDRTRNNGNHSKPDLDVRIEQLDAMYANGSSNKRLKNTYMMPDGTLVSGKGLGRGRPGIKRGPRHFKGSSQSMSEMPAPQIIPAGVLNGKKRKRLESNPDSNKDEKENAIVQSESGSDSEHYDPQASQTRSGRQTQKPTAFVPDSENPAAKKPKLVEKKAPIPIIKKKDYRGKERNALCEHCLRGHGPLGNAIVFCDGCNRCWHQRCHGPMISRDIIVDTAREWFCTTCEAALAKARKPGRGRPRKRSISNGLAPALIQTSHTIVPPMNLAVLVSGQHLSIEQRQHYLQTLPRDTLIELLIHATHLAPDIPVFDPALLRELKPVREMPLPGSNRDTSSASAPGQDIYASGDDGYYSDENAKLYPKPGHGVKLPPESEDLDMLLEGPDCRTFSHWVRPPTSAENGMK